MLCLYQSHMPSRLGRPRLCYQSSILPYPETFPSMPYYCPQQDCHYFYRTALRGLNVSTSVSPIYD